MSQRHKHKHVADKHSTAMGKGEVRERGEYSCCWRAMTRGSSFLMSWGYHWATFSPKSFMRRTLCGDFFPEGFNWCPNILPRASDTPSQIAELTILFNPPLAISLFSVPLFVGHGHGHAVVSVRKKNLEDTGTRWLLLLLMKSSLRNYNLTPLVYRFSTKFPRALFNWFCFLIVFINYYWVKSSFFFFGVNLLGQKFKTQKCIHWSSNASKIGLDEPTAKHTGEILPTHTHFSPCTHT